MIDVVVATVDGVRHEIPGMWIAGATHGGRRTIEEAVRIWHEQYALEREAMRPDERG